ncbi:hypothetical protein QTI33_27005 [Variovorax sp. J22P271]|uniref:hypothetical protein n=1 Tax=Variovorax davisae TaxID=3053515 RepID=UPI002574912A|nr:hypothetical protein [Variovorax sp. J22P271]MDM0035811.1 hypothetical protein [Variovorax sp. J22P271]
MRVRQPLSAVQMKLVLELHELRLVSCAESSQLLDAWTRLGTFSNEQRGAVDALFALCYDDMMRGLHDAADGPESRAVVRTELIRKLG